MDQATAAAALGVAAYTVKSMEADGDRWAVTVRDMASRTDGIRYLPREAAADVPTATDAEVFADVLVAEPEPAPAATVTVAFKPDEAVVAAVKKAVKKAPPRKPKA